MAANRLRRLEVTLQKVVFDSSFLMAVVEHPTTWFEDMVDAVGRFEPVLLKCVDEELERLAAGEGRRAKTARVALELASKFSIKPCGRASVDDEIVSAALSSGAIVATADAALLVSLKGAGARAFALRKGRTHLT